jgi:hypothetical protein
LVGWLVGWLVVSQLIFRSQHCQIKSKIGPKPIPKKEIIKDKVK